MTKIKVNFNFNLVINVALSFQFIILLVNFLLKHFTYWELNSVQQFIIWYWFVFWKSTQEKWQNRNRFDTNTLNVKHTMTMVGLPPSNAYTNVVVYRATSIWQSVMHCIEALTQNAYTTRSCVLNVCLWKYTIHVQMKFVCLCEWTLFVLHIEY